MANESRATLRAALPNPTTMLASADKHRADRRTLKALVALVTLLAACVAGAALTAPSAEAKTRFEIRGKGYGHGVGMSQWGAYGLAKKGKSHKRILGHYYKGTKVKKAKSGKAVRVLLGVRDSTVLFAGARRACGKKLKPGTVYRADLDGKGKNVRLERTNGKKLAGCGGKLTAKPNKGKLKIDGEGKYRGALQAVAASGDLNVVNRVGIDDYVRGVVPGEVPTSWPAAALRAQSVAARSYALATGVDGKGYDLYDDTRSQVYVGVAAEQSSSNKAVKKTARQIVTYKGSVIPTFFFSSSGGRTENVEYGFPNGTPRPYLKSVKDSSDKASPYFNWKVRYSKSELDAALGDFVQGKLKAVRISKTGVSPRIVKAKVVGTGGKTTVNGDDLRFRLGLRSTWAKFVKIKK